MLPDPCGAQPQTPDVGLRPTLPDQVLYSWTRWGTVSRLSNIFSQYLLSPSKLRFWMVHHGSGMMQHIAAFHEEINDVLIFAARCKVLVLDPRCDRVQAIDIGAMT